MTEPSKVADTTDARQASMSRVVTQETLLENLKPVEPTLEASTDQVDSSEPAEGAQTKAKKSPQERIVELAHRRREAEAEAEAAKSEVKELKERLKLLEEGSKAAPIVVTDEPKRENFATEDEFIDALTTYKADRAIAKREHEQEQAQLKAEFDAIEEAYAKRVGEVIKLIPDFAEVVGNANYEIHNLLVMAMKENKQGPLLAYFFATNPDEIRSLNKMCKTRPASAVLRLNEIAQELADDEPTTAKSEAPKAKRAPEPITPLKGSKTPNPAPAKNFAEYKARRIAEKQ